MTAERDPRDALEDILENMELARRFPGDSASTDQIEEDPKTLYSVVRALEVVGEATKRVPGWVRQMDPAVPWKEMAGMRDKLIHAYETVDLEVVLKTVRERIPGLEPRIRALRDRLASSR